MNMDKTRIKSFDEQKRDFIKHYLEEKFPDPELQELYKETISMLRGAFEIGLIYVFRKNNVFVPKKRSCPIYM